MRYGWDLAEDRWRDLRNLLDGRQWNRAYLESDYDTQVVREPGVYLICASPRNIPVGGVVMRELYNAIYVGQARNLRVRFKDHVRGYREVQRAKAVFRRLDFWYTTVRVEELSQAEQVLISALGPTANAKNVKARVNEPRPAGRSVE